MSEVSCNNAIENVHPRYLLLRMCYLEATPSTWEIQHTVQDSCNIVHAVSGS